jgi:uncharacterized membrane protein
MSAQGVKRVQTTDARSNWFTLRNLSLLLIGLGILVSGYLSYIKFTEEPMVCAEDAGFNCDVVQNSVYAEVGGVAIAYLGLATYLVLGALILVENRLEVLREYGPLLVFAIALFAFVYSMYLVYIQAFVLEAFCQWCLMHELIITVLIVVVTLRLRRHLMA